MRVCCWLLNFGGDAVDGVGDVWVWGEKDVVRGQFFIAVVAVKWYNDDQVVDVVAVVIYSMAMVFHEGGGVYVIGDVVIVVQCLFVYIGWGGGGEYIGWGSSCVVW